MEENLEKLNEGFEVPLNEYSSLTLAFLGDAVFEVYVRSKVMKKYNMPPDALHRKAVKYVKASGQCKAYDNILPYLTEAEITVFKRGRNSKVNTKAKNASIADYKKATGFEALIGFLYIKGENERLNELLKIATDF